MSETTKIDLSTLTTRIAVLGALAMGGCTPEEADARIAEIENKKGESSIAWKGAWVSDEGFAEGIEVSRFNGSKNRREYVTFGVHEIPIMEAKLAEMKAALAAGTKVPCDAWNGEGYTPVAGGLALKSGDGSNRKGTTKSKVDAKGKVAGASKFADVIAARRKAEEAKAAAAK